jgi:phosphatidylglycerophosphatase A
VHVPVYDEEDKEVEDDKEEVVIDEVLGNRASK